MEKSLSVVSPVISRPNDKALDDSPYVHPSFGANSRLYNVASLFPEETPSKPNRRAIRRRIFMIKNEDEKYSSAFSFSFITFKISTH